MMIWPQLLMFTGTGATKSLTSEVNEAADRLFRNTLPKDLQVPGGITPAPVRLMAASPNVFATRLRGAFGGMGSVTVVELTAPSEFAELRVTWLPQHGTELALKHPPWLAFVSHVFRLSTGVPPPFTKSNATRRSPAVRMIVCGPAVP